MFLAVAKHHIKDKVRFACWGAEENGRVGSWYYCSNLNAPEANRILAYLNFDMVSRGITYISDGDGSEWGDVGRPAPT